ncbi:hypothetical protein RB653_005563 [Dictyostelium firmibasis]|uniref:Uncharacterized protein n=1 Tax=Dictyostelium firmibasis TaxID=79012 RepID=A0AAN7Z173_9MYCE
MGIGDNGNKKQNPHNKTTIKKTIKKIKKKVQ